MTGNDNSMEIPIIPAFKGIYNNEFKSDPI